MALVLALCLHIKASYIAPVILLIITSNISLRWIYVEVYSTIGCILCIFAPSKLSLLLFVINI